MARVYQSVCNEIDNLLVKTLSLSEDLISEKLRLEAVMNDGYVNIAKARYIMGSKCVSILQLPTENSSQTLKALSTICRKNHKSHMVFHVITRQPSTSTIDYKDAKEQKSGKSEKNDTEAYQRRGTLVINDDQFDETQDELSLESNIDLSNINEYSDPIKLFGVLVPHTLKIAQQNFKDSLQIIGKCATIQSELDNSIIRYDHLLKIKILIEKAASARGLHIHGSVGTEKSALSYSTSLSSRTAKSEATENEVYSDDIEVENLSGG